jgi:hypothetical protein
VTHATPENRLKGRIAEGLVEAMFLHAGFEIRRTGFEWLRPLFPHHNEETERQINWRLGTMPDFCIVRSKGNLISAEYVEVKFRSDGKLSREDIKKLQQSNPWRPALILVQLSWPNHSNPAYANDKCRIRVSEYPYKKNSGCHLFDIPIYGHEDWQLSRELCDWADGMLDLLYKAWPEVNCGVSLSDTDESGP